MHFSNHLESNDTTNVDIWVRDCIDSKPNPLGCEKHFDAESNLVIQRCICTDNLCNKEMGPMPDTTPATSTVVTTTTTGNLTTC